MIVVFSREVKESIFHHAIREYPFECCGILSGMREPERVIVDGSIELKNIARDKSRRFNFDPLDYLAIEERLDSEQKALVGIYHSHPDHPARPSSTDREYAQDGFLYPIIEIKDRKIADIRIWSFREEAGFVEVECIEWI